MSDVTIEPAAARMPSGLDELRHVADDEDIGIVANVVDRWIDGTQRYARPGESLLVAVREGVVVAVGGLAWCPGVAGALRMRRFYVSPTARRHGIARDLALRLIGEAAPYAAVVTCNAQASPAAPSFWESLGFVPDDADGITHRLELMTS